MPQIPSECQSIQADIDRLTEVLEIIVRDRDEARSPAEKAAVTARMRPTLAELRQKSDALQACIEAHTPKEVAGTYVTVGDGLPLVIARGDLANPSRAGVRISLFALGKDDGKVWERSWDGGGWSWHDTGFRGAALSKGGAMLVHGVPTLDAKDLRMHLYVQNFDTKLHVRYWDGASWTWSDTGKELGRYLTGPEIVAHGDLSSPDQARIRVHVYVRGAMGEVWDRYWDGTRWIWVNTEFPGKFTGRVSAFIHGDLESVNPTDVQIQLFARSLDGTLWQGDGTNWTWKDMGVTGVGDAFVIAHGLRRSLDPRWVRMRVYQGGPLSQGVWDGERWSWYVMTGTRSPRPLAAHVRGSPISDGIPATDDPQYLRMLLYTVGPRAPRGFDSYLHEFFWDGEKWSGSNTEKELPSASYASAALIARGDLTRASAAGVRINLFAVGRDGHLWERYWNGASWEWVDTKYPGVEASSRKPPLVLVHGDTGAVDASNLRLRSRRAECAVLGTLLGRVGVDLERHRQEN
jgi:hypothetical protein